MARKRPAAGSNGVRLLVFLLIVALLLGGCYGIYLYREHREEQRQQPSASADLVSDDQIIFGGVPRSTRADVTFTVLKNQAYMVGYSEERKDPLWSAYRVSHEQPNQLSRPKGDFITDLRTQARVVHHDYTESGYDRGHMTPNSAIARCYGAAAQRETFLLSNICPQAKNLNREVWEHLEMAELEYAKDPAEGGEVWVIDGPIFHDPVKKLRAGIAVPDAFYKILIEDSSGGRGTGVRVFAVIMPQTVKGTESTGQFVRSIKEIEGETGLEFLWKLDPRVREKLTSEVNPPWTEAN